jgi:hypothetical protein
VKRFDPVPAKWLETSVAGPEQEGDEEKTRSEDANRSLQKCSKVSEQLTPRGVSGELTF